MRTVLFLVLFFAALAGTVLSQSSELDSAELDIDFTDNNFTEFEGIDFGDDTPYYSPPEGTSPFTYFYYPSQSSVEPHQVIISPDTYTQYSDITVYGYVGVNLLGTWRPEKHGLQRVTSHCGTIPDTEDVYYHEPSKCNVNGESKIPCSFNFTFPNPGTFYFADLPASTGTLGPVCLTVIIILYSPSPSITPSISPSLTPTASTSVTPTTSPSLTPTTSPSLTPTTSPSVTPTTSPSVTPSTSPSLTPTTSPSLTPTTSPSLTPTTSPSLTPTTSPSLTPSITPSVTPTPSPIPPPNIILIVENLGQTNLALFTGSEAACLRLSLTNSGTDDAPDSIVTFTQPETALSFSSSDCNATDVPNQFNCGPLDAGETEDVTFSVQVENDPSASDFPYSVTVDLSTTLPLYVPDTNTSIITVDLFVVSGSGLRNEPPHSAVGIFYASDTAHPPTIQCGGLLIAPRWVVTAASCLSNSQISTLRNNVPAYVKSVARSYEVETYDYGVSGATQVLGVDAIFVYPGFDPANPCYNNIAMFYLADHVVSPLTLGGSAVLSRIASVAYEDGICSSARTLSTAHVVPDVDVTFTGFGNNDTQLTLGDSTYINRSQCAARLGVASIPNTIHCISGDVAGSNPSTPAVPLAFGPPAGAPMYLQDPNNPSVDPAIGLFSCREPTTDNCNLLTPENTLLYTRLGTFANFIGETISNCHHFDETIETLLGQRNPAGRKAYHGRHQNGGKSRHHNGNNQFAKEVAELAEMDGSVNRWQPVSDKWHHVSHQEHSYSQDQMKRAVNAGMFD